MNHTKQKESQVSLWERFFILWGRVPREKIQFMKTCSAERGFRCIRSSCTRHGPIRAGETDGVQYHFVTEEQLKALEHAGKVIELRTYQTVYGPWHYFTVDSPELSNADIDYLALGTLESFRKIQEYYGKEKVYPIYIQVEDEQRLLRAIKREKKQENPNFKEVCRRYLADEEDFSEEKLQAAGSHGVF